MKNVSIFKLDKLIEKEIELANHEPILGPQNHFHYAACLLLIRGQRDAIMSERFKNPNNDKEATEMALSRLLKQWH